MNFELEVSRAVSKLKKKKAPGPDGLLAKHLKAGGEAVVIWLMNILNATAEYGICTYSFEEGCCHSCV